MTRLTIKHILTLGALALAAGAYSAPAPAPTPTPAALALSSRQGAVTRTLSLQNWRTDKRGVPSFEYHYRQSGPGCDYQRDGRAVAGFEENGGKVELEVFNPEGADGKESASIAVYYDADSSVIFSMPVAGKSRRVWVSFEDAVLKKTLPKKCGHAGRGDAVMFKQ